MIAKFEATVTSVSPGPGFFEVRLGGGDGDRPHVLALRLDVDEGDDAPLAAGEKVEVRIAKPMSPASGAIRGAPLAAGDIIATDAGGAAAGETIGGEEA
jgi:hypothetical protein